MSNASADGEVRWAVCEEGEMGSKDKSVEAGDENTIGQDGDGNEATSVEKAELATRTVMGVDLGEDGWL